MCRNPSTVRSRAGGASRARGFLLIEVLVSIVIISIGLLGMAGLHAVAVAKGGSSLLRSKATALGYAMADRVRVNLVASSAGSYFSMTPASGLSDPGCISVNCTPAQLAVSDYVEWSADVGSSLPQGAGVVCVTGTPSAPAYDGAGTVVVVKVFWSEKSCPLQGGTRICVFSTPVRPS